MRHCSEIIRNASVLLTHNENLQRLKSVPMVVYLSIKGEIYIIITLIIITLISLHSLREWTPCFDFTHGFLNQ